MNKLLPTLVLTVLPFAAAAHGDDTINFIRLHKSSTERALQVNEVLEHLEWRIELLEELQKQLLLRMLECGKEDKQ